VIVMPVTTLLAMVAVAVAPVPLPEASVIVTGGAEA